MNFETTSFLEIIAYKACTFAFPFGNVPAQANPAKVCVQWDKVKKKNLSSVCSAHSCLWEPDRYSNYGFWALIGPRVTSNLVQQFD